MSSRTITLTPTLKGGLQYGVNGSNGSKTITTSTTLTSENFMIFCDTTQTSPITVTLPAVSNYNIFYIIDSGGNASTKNITITPNSGTISGQTSIVISTNYSSLTIATNGTNYFII